MARPAERSFEVADKLGLVPGKQERKPKRRWAPIGVSLFVLLMAAGTIFAIRSWPFTRGRVIQALQESTSSKVELSSFKRLYFPHFGCMIEGLVFHRDSDPHGVPLATVHRLTISANLFGLLRKQISEIRAEGAYVVVPAFGTGRGWPIQATSSRIVVDSFIANGATIDFTSQEKSKPPVRFFIRESVLHGLGSGHSIEFHTSLRNPQPPGEVQAQGNLGPWVQGDPGRTPLQCSYSFQHADLSVFGGITGMLSSDGVVSGKLERLLVQGDITVPDFGLRRSGHSEPLNAQFRASVNGANGDVILEEVRSQLARTEILSHGTIASRAGQEGKFATIDSIVREGHVEDLLYLFARAPQSPLRGIISFEARTELPPGASPFLQKVTLQGNFGIADSQPTRTKTRDDLDKLSAEARGEKPDLPQEDVLSNLQGRVISYDGIAHFSQLSFRLPGAHAKLSGTYDLLSERIDMQGILSMQAKLSQASSGIKSFLLKVVDPFLKKNHRGGAKVHLRIGGTYEHPSYGVAPM